MDRLNVPKSHEHRLGKISIAEVPNILMDLPFTFYKIAFIPLHVSVYEYKARLIYTGYSPRFDKLSDGDCVPEYILEFRDTGQEIIIERVRRITDELVIRKFPREG